EMDWPEAADQLIAEVEGLLERQYDRLLGDGKAISRDLDPFLERISDYTTDEGQLMELLGVMMEGQRLVFDRRTHRQGFQSTRRLNYAFLCAQMLQNRPAQAVTDQVLDQLEGAKEVLGQAWGRFEWTRLSQNNITLDQLDDRITSRIIDALGEERYQSIGHEPLSSLTTDDRQAIMDQLGWFDQNEATRQLLLGVISELWVDYLTRVEALRVSIGLEAYAQRDPLVQYKSRATEMFQQLLADIRMGVVSRLFTFRPRTPQAAVAEARTDGAAASGPDGSAASTEQARPVPTGKPQAGPTGDGKKKRKRH
ncbi:MAG TPA: hypothetical protein VF806_09880, partial [Anaerolineaceae bacterium]